MLDFQNATLLSYNHRNNFGGGEVFRTGSVKEISVRGFIQSKTQNKDIEGVKEAQLQIQDFIDVANDWEDITINGHNFGKGRVVSIDFVSSASTFQDNVRFAQFSAKLEIPTSTNGDELYNLRGETYRGVLSSIDKTSSALSEFDESFDFDIAEDNTYSYSHNLTVNFVSGVQPEMIASGARYDSNKEYFIKNLESDEKYLLTQSASESLRRIDTSANIISSDGEFTPTDTSAIDIAESSRVGSTASSSSYSASYLPANAIDSDNDTDFVAKTKDSGADNYQWWEIDLGHNVYDLTKILVRNRGVEIAVNNSGGYAIGDHTSSGITVDAIPKDLLSGAKIYFENGGIFTLTSGASSGATSIVGNLTVANLVDDEKGDTVSSVTRLYLNNFRISVFEEGYTKNQNVTADVLATSHAKYLTYSSDHYNADNTFPDPDLTVSLPAGVYGRYIRIQWLSMTTTGGGTNRIGVSSLGFSEFQLYSSRSIVKAYNASASTDDLVKASVKLIKTNPIAQSKKAARRIFEARPALGFIDAKYSGYYQVTGKSLYSETYDLSNHTCSFGKSFSLSPETGTNYSVKYDHTLSIGEDGISVITENGKVKGREVPFFSTARTAAETEIQNSYSRVTGMFSGYCAGYNNGSYFLPYTSGINHGPSGMYIDVFDRPTDISRTYNSGEGSVDYSVTYSNDPKITGSYFHERNISISKDAGDIFSVEENGTISLYQSRRISPQSLKDIYNSMEAIIEVTIDNSGGYSIANGLTMSVNTLSDNISSGTKIYFKSGGEFTLTSGASSGATQIVGNLETANVSNDEKGNTTSSIKTRCQKALNDYRSKTNDYISVMTLNAVSSRINFKAHGKTLTYGKEFSDDKTLIDSNNLKKFSLSVSDSPPVYISTDYQIPNFGRTKDRNGYIFNQKGNYATMGKRTVTCNGVLRRVNTHNHLDIYSPLFTTDNLISYDNGDTSGLSVMTALKYMRTQCKVKARDVWSNFGLNKNSFKEIYVSDVSYSFDSQRNVSLTMSFDYAGGRSDFDLAYRDGGLIEKVINNTT